MSRTSKARVLKRFWRVGSKREGVSLREFARRAASGGIGDKMLCTQALTWLRAKRIAPVSS